MNIDKWIKKNKINLQGKYVAITGATGSIGKHVCDILAKSGANLILLDRNIKKSNKLKSDLLEKYPNTVIKNYQVDMENIDSVKRVCKILIEEPIDVLILNAGAYGVLGAKNELGYDNVFQINFISPYYMVKTLLPSLRQRQNAKVVITSSISYNFVRLNLNNIDFFNKKPMKTYGNSKRFLLFSLFELLKHEENVSFCPAHPGVSLTGIIQNYPKFLKAIIKYPMKILFMSPKKACLSIVKATSLNCEFYEWIGPRVFRIWGMPKKGKVKCSKSESEKIYQIAESIYERIK